MATSLPATPSHGQECVLTLGLIVGLASPERARFGAGFAGAAGLCHPCPPLQAAGLAVPVGYAAFGVSAEGPVLQVQIFI